MLNRQVGSYRITEKLAAGGMGEVFLARHETLDRDAVVKVLHPRLSHDKEQIQRFINEANAAESIKHPGIVKIYDIGYLDGQACIIMERLHGETLAARIARRPPTVRQSVTIIRQLAGALGAAHARNIIHRDLKPENIFLVPDAEVVGGERVKVLDFGVAKLAAQNRNTPGLTAEGAIFGTPAYMAPEQCSDAATVDQRADVYAIGCIFYELLCGQPPFGRGGLELLAAHLRDQPAPPSTHNRTVSEDLDEIILRLLAKDPNDRLQSCDGLLRALENADISPRRTGTLLGVGMSDALALAAALPPKQGTAAPDITQTGPLGSIPARAAAETVDDSPGALPGIARAGMARGGTEVGTAITLPAGRVGTASASATRAGSLVAEDSAESRLRSAHGDAGGPEEDDFDSAPTSDRETNGSSEHGSARAPMTEGMALPSTPTHASGQMHQARPGRSRKTGLVAALALVVVAAGAAGMALRGRAGTTSDVPVTRPVVHLEQFFDAAPVPPAPEDDLVAKIQAALDKREWQEATQLADTAEPDSPSYAKIMELRSQAQAEDENRYTFKVLAGAAEDNKLSVMVYAYEQLPSTSVYYPEATLVYEAKRKAYLAKRFEEARKYAAKRQCSKVHAIEHEIGTLFPSDAEAAQALYQDCRDGRNPRPVPSPGSGSTPKPGTGNNGSPSTSNPGQPGEPTSQPGETPPSGNQPPPAETPPAGGQQSGSTPPSGTPSGDTQTQPPATDPPAGSGGETTAGTAGTTEGEGAGSGTASIPTALANANLPDKIPLDALDKGVAEIQASIKKNCSKLIPEGGMSNVSFIIQTSGRVGKVDEVTIGSEEFQKCVWDAVRAESFPRAKSETRIAIPLTLAAKQDTSSASQPKTQRRRPAKSVSK